MMRIRDRPSEHSPIYNIIRYSEGKDTLAVVAELNDEVLDDSIEYYRCLFGPNDVGRLVLENL